MILFQLYMQGGLELALQGAHGLKPSFSGVSSAGLNGDRDLVASLLRSDDLMKRNE